MSINPFKADNAIRSRYEALEQSCGEQVRSEIRRSLPGGRDALDQNSGNVLAAADCARIIGMFGLADEKELMLLSLDVARAIARPPISNFFVGAAGLERETGDIVFGGNLEFPGTHLGYTMHGEGFVFTRAFSRGTTIEAIALGEAHPCAHCRQYLSEFSTGSRLQLIDRLGHQLTMSELYPWPFDPAYLGQDGAVSGRLSWPGLAVAKDGLPEDVSDLLLAAGGRSHAPYSRCPGAIVLQLADGATVSGSAVESVAFNPTVGPLQAAITNLVAHGYDYEDIRGAVLGTVSGGAVDYSAATRELLGRIAPGARLHIADWIFG